MKEKYCGCFIPIITPFNSKNELDEGKLRFLVNYLINEQKAEGLVPCGTTGECPTLSDDEFKKVVRIVVEETNGRVPVMAGTGTNSTDKTIKMTKYAEEVGADACLVVVPYYNRPSQDGLYEHFKVVANATSLPIFIYNIPIRTGLNMENKTTFRLYDEVENIIGIKDASGSLLQTMELINYVKNKSKKFFVLSGEDLLTYPLLSIGGDGVIAASAHIAGTQYRAMCAKALSGDLRGAEAIHFEIMGITKALFAEPNPTAIKACYKILGMDFGDVRMPLIPAKEATFDYLKNELKKLGLLPKI